MFEVHFQAIQLENVVVNDILQHLFSDSFSFLLGLE